MENFTIGIMEPEGFPLAAFQQLEWLGPVICFDRLDEASFLTQVDALFVRLGRHLDEALLAKAPRLKYLCSPTTGLTHLDLAAIEKRGIRLFSLKGEVEFLQGIRATPEHALGLTLGLLRHYHCAFRTPENPSWNRNLYIGHELYGKRVGIVGFGRVGRILASYFQAFGCKVIAVNRSPVQQRPDYVELASDLAGLLSAAEIVVIAASYDPSNDGLFSRELLALLKGKYLINIARGELMDEAALLELIAADHFAGVALDVLRDETQGIPHLKEFLHLTQGHNLLLTPHIAGATEESMEKAEYFIAEKLIAHLRGKTE